MTTFVIIPVHNRLGFTRACLASLREQSWRDFSVTVVDDGSTDGTHVALAEEFPEVSLLWGDGDLWWTGAMNRALERVLLRAGRSDHILVLNNDTALPPDHLDTVLELSRRRPRSPHRICGSQLGRPRVHRRRRRAHRLADDTLDETRPRANLVTGSGTTRQGGTRERAVRPGHARPCGGISPHRPVRPEATPSLRRRLGVLPAGATCGVRVARGLPRPGLQS